MSYYSNTPTSYTYAVLASRKSSGLTYKITYNIAFLGFQSAVATPSETMSSPPHSPNLEHDLGNRTGDSSTLHSGSGLNVTLERSGQSSAQIERDKQKDKAPPIVLCCSRDEEEDFQVSSS